MSGRFQDNVSFSRYVELLLRLHELIRNGQGDETEADDVRDQMDEPWEHLDSDEIECIRGLSTDLYTIGVDRAVVGEIPDAEADSFAKAMNSEQFSLALEILRRVEAVLPPEDVAIQRGICWKQMQQPGAAAAFFQESLRIAPQDSRAIALVMQSLLSADRFGEARQLALRLLHSDQNELSRMIAAKGLLVAAPLNEIEIRALAMTTIVEAVNRLKSTLGGDEFVRDQVRFALLALATSYEALGQVNQAIDVCNRALELDPLDPYAHELKGSLLVQANPEHAPFNIRQELFAHIGRQTESALFNLAPSHN